jgi:hypothetical protein
MLRVRKQRQTYSAQSMDSVTQAVWLAHASPDASVFDMLSVFSVEEHQLPKQRTGMVIGV